MHAFKIRAALLFATVVGVAAAASPRMLFASGTNEERQGLQMTLPPDISNRFTYTENAKQFKGITHSEALFGVPEFGGELNGRIFYATPGNDTGCHAYSPHPSWVNERKYILLVDRGECNFVQKVRYAEQQGAMGVVIVDNKCMSDEPKGTCKYGCRPDKQGKCPKQGCDACTRGEGCNAAQTHPEWAYQAPDSWASAPGLVDHTIEPMTPFSDISCDGNLDYRLPVMADDGSGHNIAIPSYLISHYDGQLIKDAICGVDHNPWNPHTDDATAASDSCKSGNGGAVMMTMRWDVPKPSGKVTWSLWTSSEDWHGATFKQEFKDIAKRLYGKAEFSPNYFFYDGRAYGCQNSASRCGNQCLNNGKPDDDGWEGGYYCRPDPDGSLDQGISGAEIAEENLRQLCLWEMKNGTAAGQAMWWTYVDNFAMKCFGLVQETAGLEKCHTGQLTAAGVSPADQVLLDKCVADNSVGQSDMLDRMIEQKSDLNILVLPTIMVNGRLMAGGTQPLTVLKEICSGFLEGTAPDACAAALNPLGNGQAGADGFLWKVSSSMLLGGLETPSDFDYTLRQNFKQRLGLELGVVYSSIQITSVNPATTPAKGLLIGLVVNNLASEEAANTVSSALVQSENDGYFSLVTSSDKRIDIFAAGGGAPTIVKTSAQTGQAAGPTNVVNEGVPAGVVVFIVFLIIGAFGGAGFWYYRRTQNQMRAQVRNILAEYMPLDDNPGMNMTSSKVMTAPMSESETAAMI